MAHLTNPFGHLESSSGLPTFDRLAKISLESSTADYGIKASSAIASSWLSPIWKQLHYYFDVTNSYVVKKLQLLLVPFLFGGDWNQELDTEGLARSPRHNLHAPDLYIPLMSFITFVLLTGIHSGSKGEFSPEVLGLACSTSIIFMFLELLFVYAGFYFMQSSLPAFFDTLGYCGYKFVACVLNLGAKMTFGGEFYYPVFVYTGCMLGIFLTKTLKRYTDSFSEYVDVSTVTKHSFLYVVALIQFPIIFFLGFY